MNTDRDYQYQVTIRNIHFLKPGQDCLMICPSRLRPDRIRELIDSFHKNTTDSTALVVYISKCDPRLKEYEAALEDVTYIIGDRVPIVTAFNRVALELFPGFKYYGELNDDHVIHTPKWDAIYKETIEKHGGWGISYGDDLHDRNKHQHPSGCIMSGDVIRTLNCMFLPRLKHMYADNYLKAIFQGINRMHFHPDVVIEHKHFLVGKAPKDANYEYVYDPMTIQEGHEIFYHWYFNDCAAWIQKLNDAIVKAKGPATTLYKIKASEWH